VNKYIALLRGINVGGKNILPMKELTALMEGLGCQNVKTYIQSGNVVFLSKNKPSDEIASAIEKSHGIKPELLLLSEKDFKLAIKHNPYNTEQGKMLHFYFCKEKPKEVDFAKLEALKVESEHFTLKGKVLYLYTPDGFGRSKLAAKIEKCLGVPVTARNNNTVEKLLAMLDEI
jgi:uncharacterized protein (DUF1697 family)